MAEPMTTDTSAISYTLPVEDLINGLTRFFNAKAMCDAELRVEGKIFNVHRLILAAYSPYFEASYVGKFKESAGGSIELQQGVSSAGLSVVLQGLYTTQVNLTCDNVVDVLTTAHFLQIRHIIAFCEKFLEETMSREHCLQYLKLAEVYNLDPSIINLAEQCFVQNFLAVSQEEDFLDLSKDALCRYMNSKDIECRELDILKAGVRWLMHTEDRMMFAPDVLQCVRLALFKTPELISEVLRLEFIASNPDCRKLVDEAINYSSNPYSQPLYSGSLNKARASETLILLEEGTRYPGRYETSDTASKLYFVKHDSGSWTSWEETVDIPFAFCSAAPIVMNNFLFIHGVDGRFCGNVMIRFDGSNRTWMNLTPIPQQATVGYVAASVGPHIILTGGLLIDKDSPTTVSMSNILKRTFSYSIEHNEWQMVNMLPYKVAFASGCTLKSRNLIFVTGGYTDINGMTKKTNKVVAYDPTMDLWLSKAPLNNPRVQHSCAEYDGRIFVVGGGGNPEQEVSETCEIFCPETEQWTVIQAGHNIKGSCQIIYRHQLLSISGKKPVLKFVTDKNKWKRTDFTPPCKAAVVTALQVARPTAN